MKIIFLAPLLLTGCISAWPVGSYMQLGSEADMNVLAPAVNDCMASIFPQKSSIALASGNEMMLPLMTDVLTKSGFTFDPAGQPVTYVIAPVETGEFIRLSSPHGTCSQYFARTDGVLKPAGPLMVMTQ